MEGCGRKFRHNVKYLLINLFILTLAFGVYLLINMVLILRIFTGKFEGSRGFTRGKIYSLRKTDDGHSVGTFTPKVQNYSLRSLADRL